MQNLFRQLPILHQSLKNLIIHTLRGRESSIGTGSNFKTSVPRIMTKYAVKRHNKACLYVCHWGYCM